MTKFLVVGFVVLVFLAGCATPGEVVDRCADHWGVESLRKRDDVAIARCGDGTMFVFDGWHVLEIDPGQKDGIR